MQNDQNSQPIEVPLEALSPTALQGLIESFILREGTDYGAQEMSHERKIEQIRRQLESAKIVIVYDQASDSVTLMNRSDLLSSQPTR